jgi:SAM-dependent MidA family methyltransferase
VRFAQFFDAVRNLQSFFDFHRDLLLSIAGAIDESDPELAQILYDANQRLKELSDELRLTGVLLITDYGEPVHKRLLGLKEYAA